MISKEDNDDSELVMNTVKIKTLKQAYKLESLNAFINYTDRLQMLFLPNCSNLSNCQHESKKKLQLWPISPKAINSINMERSRNMWNEALEISFLCITPKQYLTADVLRDIVEIMLNAHEDVSYKYSVSHLIRKCEQVLALHFRMHPPCIMHDSILNVYKSFLLDPMTSSTNHNNRKHSTRNDYGCDKGIIQYCFNRLEYEISSVSPDGPLIDKDQIIPDNIKEGIRGKHYEKEQLEIYELLNRSDRIDRLMAVLRSTVELLQFNLFIIKSRQSRQKFLMNDLFSLSEYSEVPIISRQIAKIFAYFVHLDYPPEHIKIMNIWLNMVIEIQTYYDMTYNNRNFDYPMLKKYAKGLAEDFHEIISDLPHESIIKIITMIHPNYMQCAVGLIYIKVCLSYDDYDIDIINIIVEFLKSSKWTDFPDTNSVNLLKKINKIEGKPKNIIEHLSNICKTVTSMSNNKISYPKLDINVKSDITQDIIISALYITLKAFLDSYNVQNVTATLKNMNSGKIVDTKTSVYDYHTTDNLLKVYRKIYDKLPTMFLLLRDLKKDNKLPDKFKVFENFSEFDLLGYSLYTSSKT